MIDPALVTVAATLNVTLTNKPTSFRIRVRQFTWSVKFPVGDPVRAAMNHKGSSTLSITAPQCLPPPPPHPDPSHQTLSLRTTFYTALIAGRGLPHDYAQSALHSLTIRCLRESPCCSLQQRPQMNFPPAHSSVR
ncbi:hypothetical protein BaRGS_00001231 [Batillaria attramentaria]|uniref:Uncharacterized protein n=1 Tax=Batillaria attramentaria TaxID=370345 RepID=A0ABD0M6L4_9CAEN